MLLSLHKRLVKKNIAENTKYEGKPWFKPNTYVALDLKPKK